MLSRSQRMARYGGRAPRYTSYPTANHFAAMGPTPVRDALASVDRSPSVYVHVPYCTKLCWYCGCNTTIRRDRTVGDRFVDGLLQELAVMAPNLPEGMGMKHLALGGGTPNFLKNEALTRLILGIEEVFGPEEDTVKSTELDPRTVEPEQLEAFIELGFRKFSLGVQSLNREVQQLVNRPLSPGRLWSICKALRSYGATSLNLDLMIGLPRQTPATMDETLDSVLAIRPERLALFQYAHMPSLRPAQKLLARHGLPGPEERDALFVHTTQRLLQAGYDRIGFDHFALRSDPMAVALRTGRLNRNFQGFTDDTARDLIALGPSAIGQIGRLFYQNHRDVGPWQTSIDNGVLPVVRGLLATQQDAAVGKAIQELLCQGRVSMTPLGDLKQPILDRLRPLAADGLVVVQDDEVCVTEEGFDWVRSIAATFDQHLDRSAHSNVA